jgi:hypothetical protein
MDESTPCHTWYLPMRIPQQEFALVRSNPADVDLEPFQPFLTELEKADDLKRWWIDFLAADLCHCCRCRDRRKRNQQRFAAMRG